MARAILLLPLLLIAACSELPGEDEGGTIGYDRPADIAPSGGDAANSAPTLPTGRYGVSAADCDDGNTYMTEYVELDADGFTYRGESYRFLAEDSDGTFVFRRADGIGERVQIKDGRFIRWPDRLNQRTTYSSCE